MSHRIALYHDPLNVDIYQVYTSKPAENHLDFVRFNSSWPIRTVSAQRKRVVFNNKIRIVENPGFLTSNEIERVWWSGDELQSIKKRAKQMCCRLRKRLEPEVCPVSDAYQKTKMVLNSDTKHPALCLANGLGGDLYQWCTSMDGRRGLERFASREFAALRRKDVIDTRSAVMQEQKQQAQAGERNAEAIANVAKLSSKTARVFAAFMGDADANVSLASEELMEDEWSDCSQSSVDSDRPSKRNKLNSAGNSPAA